MTTPLSLTSCEGYIVSLVKANVRHSSSVHELFGFDIMLDKHLKPWLLEVNVSPRYNELYLVLTYYIYMIIIII